MSATLAGGTIGISRLAMSVSEIPPSSANSASGVVVGVGCCVCITAGPLDAAALALAIVEGANVTGLVALPVLLLASTVAASASSLPSSVSSPVVLGPAVVDWAGAGAVAVGASGR